MIEYADVELSVTYDLRVPINVNLVCVMGLDVDGQSWVPREIELYDDENSIFRGMQKEKYMERTRVVPRILSLKVFALKDRQSFRWSGRVVPEYRWCHRINWIKTLEMASSKVVAYINNDSKQDVMQPNEAKQKGV